MKQRVKGQTTQNIIFILKTWHIEEFQNMHFKNTFFILNLSLVYLLHKKKRFSKNIFSH